MSPDRDAAPVSDVDLQALKARIEKLSLADQFRLVAGLVDEGGSLSLASTIAFQATVKLRAQEFLKGDSKIVNPRGILSDG